MKINKLLTGISAVALISTIVLPVSANEQTTDLTAEIESTYMLTIPTSQKINFQSSTTKIGEVSVSGNIRPNEKVVVSVDKTAFVSNEDKKDVINYSLKTNNNEFTRAEWTEDILHGGVSVTYPLTVTISDQEWKEAHAGTYTSTITFRADIETVTKP